MDQALIQQQLKDGIRAVRQGDRARGRELLLQVVAADERSEPAWLWLSQAVEAPADQLIALENALTLNPANEAARARVAVLRAQLGVAAEPRAPEPQRQTPEPAPYTSPQTSLDEAPAPSKLIELEALPLNYDVLDYDPDQCLYCGKITEPDASTCPHCGRNLLKAGRVEGKSVYRGLVFLSAVITQGAILHPGLVLIFLLWKAGNFPQFLSSVPFYIMLGRIFLWLAGLLIILSSETIAPAGAVVAALVDGAVIGLSLVLGWMAGGMAALWGALDFGALALATTILAGRTQARVRQRVVLDRDAYGHDEMYRRGRRYAAEGKWALAALHWQKAMVRKPGIAEYYKDLSAAQVRLGRYPQALRTLRMGAEALPEDTEFPALMAALEESAAVKVNR